MVITGANRMTCEMLAHSENQLLDMSITQIDTSIPADAIHELFKGLSLDPKEAAVFPTEVHTVENKKLGVEVTVRILQKADD